MSDYPVLTEEGRKKLEAELKTLKEVKRQEIKKRIEQAKEHGDLSENAEYHDAREEQAFIEGRILEIEGIFKTAVPASSTSGNSVRIGSTVTMVSNSQTMEYTIVGSHEGKPEAGLISCDSPLAQAFLGKTTGETVMVDLPKGQVSYVIKNIR